MTINFKTPEIKELQPRLLVMGVGGAGGNAINEMIENGMQGVEFIAVNTDAQDLKHSKAKSKIQIGLNLTKGLGAGAKIDIGQAAADESLNEIINVLQGANMVFIAAGMGGGTGTGAAPIIAQMSKELDILTVGIVTIPFQFEGRMRSDQAQIGIEVLRDNVDSLIVINNNKLRQVYGNLGFKAGFAKADEVLATAARGIAEVITHHYRQNIDLKDAKTVLSNSGTAIMGSAVSEGSNRAEESVAKALDSPLLNDNKIKGCKNVLLLIVSGEDEITIDEIGEINDFIQSEAGNNTNIIMGIGEDKKLKQAISVTIIATGFNSEQQHEIVNTEAKKIIHTLEEEQSLVHDLSDDKNNLVDNELLNSRLKDEVQFSSVEDLNQEKIIDSDMSSKKDNLISSEDQGCSENDLIKTNQNIKDIEISHTEVDFEKNEDFDHNHSVNKNQSLESIEVLDFEKINEMDSSQIEFDFYESPIDSKNIELDNSRNENEINNGEFKKEINLENNLENEILNENEEELKLKIKKIENNNLNEEKTDLNSQIETPFDNSIEETIKKTNKSRKDELKKYNYLFKNSLKRHNNLEKEPAYRRLGYDIDQDIENEKKSQLTLDKDKNDEVQLRSNNSFLHDNVD